MDVRFTVRIFIPTWRHRWFWSWVLIQAAFFTLYVVAAIRHWPEPWMGIPFIASFAMTFGTADLYFIALSEAKN